MRVEGVSHPEALVRTLLMLLAGLTLAGCGPRSESTATAPRIYDTQRNALEKAKAVNETITQGAEALRAQEEAQTK